jgi:hypothetical protein
MSAIKNYDDALDFLPTYQGDEGLAARFGKGLKAYCTALADGLAAARAYHELTVRGVPHDKAVREVFRLHLDRR